MRFIQINWGKVLVLVLVSEMLLFYWSTLQHSQTVRELKAKAELERLPISATPQPHPDGPGKSKRRG